MAHGGNRLQIFWAKKEAWLKMHEKKVAFVQRHMFWGYGLYEKKIEMNLLAKVQ
jgi:hypothetical protein